MDRERTISWPFPTKAIPIWPFKTIMFCVLCLTNIGFVQCYSLGSWKFFARLCFGLFFSIFLLCVLCLANNGFVQCFSLASCIFLASLFCFNPGPANFVISALPLKQLFVQYFLIPSAPVKCSYAYFFPSYYLVKCFVMCALPHDPRFLLPAPLICALFLLFVILFW